MLSKKTAQVLDNAARKASEVGTKLGGNTGANIADAIVNATLGQVRSRIGEPCTCGTDCEH